MIDRIKDKYRLLFYKKAQAGEIPFVIRNRWTKNQDAPFLVSFPRTGSHWLRILLEVYSERPTLVRSFLKHQNIDFLLSHSHDENLDLKRKKVIYLYRNPVDTVFSQLWYYHQDVKDKNLVEFWTRQYAHHIIHWRFHESYAQQKLILQYENLLNKPLDEFEKLCYFLEISFDKKRFEECFSKVDKEFVKSLTPHDENAVHQNTSKKELKAAFKSDFEEHIQHIFTEISHHFNSGKNILQ